MKDGATDQQVRSKSPDRPLDLIHDLLDALDVGCDLLGQLRVIEGCQATFEHENALIAFAGDVS